MAVDSDQPNRFVGHVLGQIPGGGELFAGPQYLVPAPAFYPTQLRIGFGILLNRFGGLARQTPAPEHSSSSD